MENGGTFRWVITLLEVQNSLDMAKLYVSLDTTVLVVSSASVRLESLEISRGCSRRIVVVGGSEVLEVPRRRKLYTAGSAQKGITARLRVLFQQSAPRGDMGARWASQRLNAVALVQKDTIAHLLVYAPIRQLAPEVVTETSLGFKPKLAILTVLMVSIALGKQT